MKAKNYLAIDFGAESARVIAGSFDGNKINLQEIHRFQTGPSESNGRLYWDVNKFFKEVKEGLKKSVKFAGRFEGIGIDTWGVDFGLLDKEGKLVYEPAHYRDKRTDGIMEQIFKKVSRKEIYETTGIQFMQINTLYQLYSIVLNHPEYFEKAKHLLLMPSLFNYLLTGEKYNEFTIATTTQCYDTRKGAWAADMLKKLTIPVEIFSPVVKPATVIGKLLPHISAETGLGDIPVIAVGSHDTASAVAAIPAKSTNWAFLSSGTWSLIGCELDAPIINEQAMEYDFTNEGGIQDTIRLLKNVMGLWIVQECRRFWSEKGEDLSYQELADLAETAKPYQSFIDVNDNVFLKAGNMPEKIQKWCKKTSQPIPSDKGSIVRCVLESLAFKYRESIEKLEQIQSKTIDRIHIVGGGSNNKLLCKLTANALSMQAITGPVEATAAGNIITQLIAHKELSSLAQAREMLSNSFNLSTYAVEENEEVQVAYKKYLNIVKSKE